MYTFIFFLSQTVDSIDFDRPEAGSLCFMWQAIRVWDLRLGSLEDQLIRQDVFAMTCQNASFHACQNLTNFPLVLCGSVRGCTHLYLYSISFYRYILYTEYTCLNDVTDRLRNFSDSAKKRHDFSTKAHHDLIFCFTDLLWAAMAGSTFNSNF